MRCTHPHAAQTRSRVFRFNFANMQQVFTLGKHIHQQSLHLFGFDANVTAFNQQLFESCRPRIIFEQTLDNTLRLGIYFLKAKANDSVYFIVKNLSMRADEPFSLRLTQ